MASSKSAFNGSFSTALRNILMIISIISALAIAIASVQSRASNADMKNTTACIAETNNSITEVNGRVDVLDAQILYWEHRLDVIESKIDILLAE